MSLSSELLDKNHYQPSTTFSSMSLFDYPERHEMASTQPIAIPTCTIPSVMLSPYPFMYPLASSYAGCDNSSNMMDSRTDLLSVPSPSFGSFYSGVDANSDGCAMDFLVDDIFQPASPLSSSYTSTTFAPETPTIIQDLLSSGLDDTPLFGFESSPAESHISDAWLSPALAPTMLDATYSPSPSPNPLSPVEHMYDQYLVIASSSVQSQLHDDQPPATFQEETCRPRSRQLHQCPHCRHTSNRANNMKEHILTHDPNREKNFKCDGCDKRFARKHDMKRHYKSHTRSVKTKAL